MRPRGLSSGLPERGWRLGADYQPPFVDEERAVDFAGGWSLLLWREEPQPDGTVWHYQVDTGREVRSRARWEMLLWLADGAWERFRAEQASTAGASP